MKIKYLFLDIEWNSASKTYDNTKDEILEMAFVAFSEDFKIEKKFARIVKPEHIDQVSKETLQLLHLSKKTLEDAKEISIILEKFQKTFQQFEILIVWNKAAYHLLIENMETEKFKLPKHRVVVLQDVLSALSGNNKGKIGFERALKKYGVSYNSKQLHWAKYDVGCLKKLFCSASYQCHKQRILVEDCSMVKSSNSLVIHNVECHYVAYIKEKYQMKANIMDFFNGYALCKHCVSARRFPKLLFYKTADWSSEIQLHEEVIKKLCTQYHLKYQIGEGVIFIQTKVSSWRIYHNYEKVTEVYHENYRFKKSQKFINRKCNDGFHKQDIKGESLFEVLQYIQQHDKFFFREKKSAKQRIDILFEKLEEERRKRQENLSDDFVY